MSSKRKNPANIRAKLSKFSSDFESEDSGFYGLGLSENKKKENINANNWATQIVASGSNCFGQLSADSTDLMTTTLRAVKGTNGKGNQEVVVRIGCGSNFSVMITSDENTQEKRLYSWGTNIATGSSSSNPNMTSLGGQSVGIGLLSKSNSQSGVNAANGAKSGLLLSMVPLKHEITQLSCGQSHCAFVTNEGLVYAWGSGDYGMLGHGNKINCPQPKQIEALSHLFVTNISCGVFHTAVIACGHDEIERIPIPQPNTSPDTNNLVNMKSPNKLPTKGVDSSASRANEEYFIPGSLYTFGLGKAGQLGLDPSSIPVGGSNAGIVFRPTIVSYFESNGWKVVRTSCGFHHTLVIALPVHSLNKSNYYSSALQKISSFTFSFGWNEHGRLGLGHEEQCMTPSLVQYPNIFNATDIVAGEQHSLVAGMEGSYSWGSNSLGQLGVSNPHHTEYSCIPIQIPLPEGMRVKKFGAGGRHSAAITYCGKFLTWGWNEEGQLGHGTEKSCFLPRPCRVPKIHGKIGLAKEVALGMSHTLLLLANNDYIRPLPPKLPTPPPSPIMLKETILSPPKIIIEQPLEPIIEEKPVIPNTKKPATISEEEDDEPTRAIEELVVPKSSPQKAIRSIKELLKSREERKMSEMDINDQKEIVVEPVDSNAADNLDYSEVNHAASLLFLTTEDHLNNLLNNSLSLERSFEKDRNIMPDNEDYHNNLQSEMALSLDDDNRSHVSQSKGGSKSNDSICINNSRSLDKGFNIYYKPGQNLDNCLVANSAKRAQVRKSKKSSVADK
eukprot:gene11158-14972_t